jgi:uncharacterized protein (TIGR03435 family)
MLRAAVMLVGVVFAACTRQKPPPAQGQSAVPYAHVSISRADSATSTSIRLQDRGGLIANGATVRDLIEFAHQRHRFDRAKIVGGATWIDSERYDVTVVGETEHVFGPDASTPGAWAMLRNVLADRFDLLVDDQRRPGQAYALVRDSTRANLGPGLRKTDVDCSAVMTQRAPAPSSDHGPPCASKTPRGWLVANTVTMASLASLLSRYTDRPVVDCTGLTGRFDVVLESAEIPQAPDHRPGLSDLRLPPARPIPIAVAVHEQLGLKLVPRNEDLRVLVVRRVARPAHR